MSSFKPYLATVALAFTACARPVASNSDSLEASLRTACRTQARACVKLSKQGWRTPPRDLEDACAAARPDSCFELGLRLIDGDGVAKNEARGREMLGRSCAHGHPTACGVAGSRRLANGLASQDEAEILSSQREADALLDKACKGGALPSCVILGDSRMETGGAEPVLQRACDGGEAGGCTRR